MFVEDGDSMEILGSLHEKSRAICTCCEIYAGSESLNISPSIGRKLGGTVYGAI